MNSCVCGHAIEAHRDGAPGCAATIPSDHPICHCGHCVQERRMRASQTEPCGCALYEPEEDEDDA